jgi:hypothetical protein
MDLAAVFARFALSLRSFSARTFAFTASRSATTSCRLILSSIKGCILALNTPTSPISCRRFDALKGISMFSALRAVARNPALLALCDLYKEVNIFALKLVSGLGRFRWW